MLEEAGVKGLKAKVWGDAGERPYNPNARRMAEVIQLRLGQGRGGGGDRLVRRGEYLKRSSDKSRRCASWLERRQRRSGQLPGDLARLQGGRRQQPAAQLRHQPFEDLIQKAKIVSDQAERTKLYEQAQVIFKDSAPWATIAHSLVSEPLRKEVVNYKIDPLAGQILDGVDLK